MNSMVDELLSLGDELPNHHLMLQLHVLSKKYDYMKALIKRTKSLTSFHAIRNDLKLEKFDMETEADLTAATTLYVVSSIAFCQQAATRCLIAFALPPSYAPTDDPPHSYFPVCQHQQRVVTQDPTTPLAPALTEGVAFHPVHPKTRGRAPSLCDPDRGLFSSRYAPSRHS
jgi:hypothetical protein